jgi:protein TonB
MRPYTIAASIVAHVIGACAAVIVPLLAADELPAPRTATEFVRVVALPQRSPPPRQRALAPHVAPIPSSDNTPLAVPDGILAESPAMPPVEIDRVDGVIDVGVCNCAAVETVPAPPQPRAPLRVGGNIRAPQKIADVAPIYPAIARAARVRGVVILEAVIGEDGTVRNVRVLRSIALLDAAALEAVQQWRFTPTLLNGEPVPIVMTVTVAFTLN